jgi:hypothetical protein
MEALTNNWLSLLIGCVLGIPASVIGTYLYLTIGKRRGNRHLRSLLNLGSGEVLFVFTHGIFVAESILPRTSTEAFIAVNNIVGALIQTGWKGPVRVRDSQHIDGADKGKNLIIFSGPKKNAFTGEVLQRIKDQGRHVLEFRKTSETPERWQICSDIFQCPSPSYDQEQNARQQGKEVVTETLEDVAMIFKITNPWNGANKIMIIAGIRGIGTWGAADFLRKRADELYRQKSGTGPFKKNGDFAALLKVTYENYNIIQVDLRQLIDIT